MPYIPNDLLDESRHIDPDARDVLFIYAELSQNEGKEPDASRIAERMEMSLEATQDALALLSEKGWLERVKDYFE